jgi:hypothetical protein
MTGPVFSLLVAGQPDLIKAVGNVDLPSLSHSLFSFLSLSCLLLLAPFSVYSFPSVFRSPILTSRQFLASPPSFSDSFLLSFSSALSQPQFFVIFPSLLSASCSSSSSPVISFSSSVPSVCLLFFFVFSRHFILLFRPFCPPPPSHPLCPFLVVS